MFKHNKNKIKHTALCNQRIINVEVNTVCAFQQKSLIIAIKLVQ